MHHRSCRLLPVLMPIPSLLLQTIVAEKVSYTVFDGQTFTDGMGRNVSGHFGKVPWLLFTLHSEC